MIVHARFFGTSRCHDIECRDVRIKSLYGMFCVLRNSGFLGLVKSKFMMVQVAMLD